MDLSTAFLLQLGTLSQTHLFTALYTSVPWVLVLQIALNIHWNKCAGI